MAVFTTIDPSQARLLLNEYSLGEFVSLHGITAGIENSNYFLHTTTGKYVLTIFEVLTASQLPFYIELMHFLASNDLPVPMPQRRLDGQLFGDTNGKPWAIVTCLNGADETNPTSKHCQLAGQVQAKMHLAATAFPIRQPNLRGLTWWQATYPQIHEFLSKDLQQQYNLALTEQIQVQSSQAWLALPEGACHCDMFRDNVLFAGTFDNPRISGVIDFYFAGVDKWLFDVAVAVNDWCIDRDTGKFIPELVQAWLHAYHQVRPFTTNERELWPVTLRAAALRFWTSRLFDFYRPRPAESLKPHDPTYFEQILRQRQIGIIPELPN